MGDQDNGIRGGFVEFDLPGFAGSQLPGRRVLDAMRVDPHFAMTLDRPLHGCFARLGEVNDQPPQFTRLGFASYPVFFAHGVRADRGLHLDRDREFRLHSTLLDPQAVDSRVVQKHERRARLADQRSVVVGKGRGIQPLQFQVVGKTNAVLGRRVDCDQVPRLLDAVEVPQSKVGRLKWPTGPRGASPADAHLDGAVFGNRPRQTYHQLFAARCSRPDRPHFVRFKGFGRRQLDVFDFPSGGERRRQPERLAPFGLESTGEFGRHFRLGGTQTEAAVKSRARFSNVRSDEDRGIRRVALKLPPASRDGLGRSGIRQFVAALRGHTADDERFGDFHPRRTLAP